MLYKVIFKNFKSNLKNYILFFVSNILAVAEMFAFWGINDIVKDAIRDDSVAEILKYDFWIAAGLVTFITLFLMVFAMRHYVKLRIRDYSTFVMLGMKKRMSNLMILTEYSIGWLVSFLLGLLIGNGILYGAQVGMHHLYPEFIEITRVSFEIYRNTFLVSIGTMAVVFAVIMVWMEGKDLSSLMRKEEAKEKRPVNKKWILFTLLGIAIISYAVYGYQSGNDIHYMASHIEWVIGGFLVLAFGGGVVLGGLEKCRKFYLRYVLRLNQLYSRYQSNLFIILILFVIHFFALTYISVEIASSLPLDKYRKGYPYDMVWMAKQEDREFSEEFSEKYHGETQYIPMVRVTTYYGSQHIGISKSSYEEMTGKECSLKGREIIVGIENHEYEEENKIQGEDYWQLYQWLYIGKYTKQFEDNITTLSLCLDDSNYQYEIQDIYTQNMIGQYSIDGWHENVIVFSDEYFEEQWKQISENPEEPSVLELFTFSSRDREKAWKELKRYADENGVENEKIHMSESTLYNTEQFLVAEKMRQLFNLSSKLFIFVSFFISAFFVMEIKTLSELPAYEKRYEFLSCMGMKAREQEKNIRFEVQSISNIALGAGLCMAIIYVWSFVILSEKSGITIAQEFWKYWIIIIVGYIFVEYLIQRLFARYVIYRLRKEKIR